MGPGVLLTWEIDCRWGKEKAEDKGMMERVEKTLEAGNKRTHRGKK